MGCELALHTPPGVHADPPVQEGTLGPRERRASPLRLRADATAPLGVAIVGLDVTLDDQRYGERFDCVVDVTAPSAPRG
jgi:hypothetical protein